MASQFVPERLDGTQMMLLEEFATCMVRALGTPLTVTALAAEGLARRPDLPAAVVRDVATILVQTHRIGELLRFLLDAASPGEQSRQRIEVNGLVHEIVELLADSTQRHGVKAVVYVDAQPLYVLGDPLLLKHALLDLVAVRDMPLAAAGDMLRLELRTRGSNGTVDITVRMAARRGAVVERLSLWRADGSPGRLWRAWQFAYRQQGQVEVRADGAAAMQVIMKLRASNGDGDIA